MSVSNKLPEVGFIRLKEVLTIIPIGKSSWWAGVANGTYPQPVKISKRTTAWAVEDIRDLINNINKR